PFLPAGGRAPPGRAPSKRSGCSSPIRPSRPIPARLSTAETVERAILSVSAISAAVKQPAQMEDQLNTLGGSAVGDAMRRRRAVVQALLAFVAVASDPLPRAADAHARRRGCRQHGRSDQKSKR